MQIVIDTKQLKIAFRPGDGTNNDAIVAFAGVQGAFGGIPVEEFAVSLAHLPAMRDAWFVIDKTRGWYNQTAEGIIDTLSPLLAERRVTTLGNSMGGFGALLFGDIWGASAAIAFCPQYSVDPALVPFELRWREFTAAIPEIRYPTCLPQASAACTRFVFVGDRHGADIDHARLIQRRMAPGDRIFVLRDGRHDVAQILKQAGVLAKVIEASVTTGDVPACLDTAGLAYEVWRR